jgi:predicted CXXCH cytochrome family protein
VVASNVTRADYAGSRACQPCHQEIYGEWLRSPMRNMTRPAADANIVAPFQGERFTFKRDAITFERRDGARIMRLESATDGEHLFRVTKVIGGHHREDFVGVDGASKVERVLPATFMLESGEWRYKGYSVMTPERPALKPGAVWSKTCIFCHNTEPYLLDLLGVLGPATPPYQGEVVDALLPAGRRWRYRITDEGALRRALDVETYRLGAVPPRVVPATSAEALARAVRVTRAMFGEPHLVELGIGCEMCHLGSAEHVRSPSVRPSLLPRAPFLAVDAPQPRTRASEINRACARCHQVLFTRYPWTWEGEPRSGAHPGGTHINSGEARDFLLGACASQMSCIACHDPHAPDNREKMRELDGPKGSAVCLRCHEKYASVEAQRAHTHHDPAGAGAQCLGCHMPKKNMSLDNRLGRYHRIASPTEKSKVEGDRPLECALCHADKSVAELVTTMESWWHKSYDRARLLALYGSLDARPLEATLRMGKPHEQAVALALLGDAKARAQAPEMAVQLTHPVPIVRYFAERALQAVLGAPLAIDLFQEDAQIRAQADAKLRAAGLTPMSNVSDVPVTPGRRDSEEE